MTSKPASAQLVLKITSFILRLLLNILFYIVVIILITMASKLTYNFCYQIFGQVTASAEPGRDVEIRINKGESSLNIAGKLELNKMIVNKYSFYVKAKLKRHTIMPGTYTLNTSMTYDEIFDVITVPLAEETGSDNGEADVSGGQDTKNENTASDDTEESGESDVNNATGDN